MPLSNLDKALNIIIPLAAILFFAAVMYQNPGLKGIIDLIFGWIKKIFTKGKDKIKGEDEEWDYTPKY